MPDTTRDVTTAEQLAAMADDGNRYELVEGVLQVMSPAGSEHGEIAAELLLQFRQHAKRHGLGKTYAAETGFLVRSNPDTVLAPDAAFVSIDRLRDLGRHEGYLPLAPDLVAEVVSPRDRTGQVEAKVQLWLDAGVRVVVVVEPRPPIVRIHRANRPPQSFTDGLVDLSDVLPGFQLDVSELFA